MSYHVFFLFSDGLKNPIRVPKGTKKQILDHVQHIESVLGYETEQYKNNPKHWKSTKPKETVTDEVFCEEAEKHNKFVMWLYHRLLEWSEKPPANSETITPKAAKQFFHGLSLISVPSHRWTKGYYRARMESLYEVMRGRESEGITFDEKPLTPRQAAHVILLFSEFLDPDDLRLDVPKGCDYLASSDDGGYVWCEKCGAVTEEHAYECRKRGCPLREEYGKEVEP